MTPFARGLSNKIDAQKKKRALATDSHLRLIGIPDDSVYCLGDCATIENPRLIDHIVEFFENSDKDKVQ